MSRGLGEVERELLDELHRVYPDGQTVSWLTCNASERSTRRALASLKRKGHVVNDGYLPDEPGQPDVWRLVSAP